MVFNWHYFLHDLELQEDTRNSADDRGYKEVSSSLFGFMIIAAGMIWLFIHDYGYDILFMLFMYICCN